MNNKNYNKTVSYIFEICKLHKAIKIVESKPEKNEKDKEHLEMFYKLLNDNLSEIIKIVSKQPLSEFKQFITNKKFFYLSASVNPPNDMIAMVKKEHAYLKSQTDVNFSFSSGFDYLMLEEKNPDFKQIAKNYANFNLEKFIIFENNYLPNLETLPTNNPTTKHKKI